MLCKLSLRNVKRSIKDYAIYFLTLTFGVCLFYVFNSIDSQNSMMQITESQHRMLEMLTQVINYVSVFISVILGFLIVYANKFLIGRRKKELGIYMTLGMNRSSISRLLIMETFLISIFSLGVGLLLGVFASQGLSVLTARLFEVDLSGYRFVFSRAAFIKSILYFGVIFLVVMVFNTFAVIKLKLIDLLYASKKNENLRIKHLWISVILFAAAVASLAFAYRCIIKNGFLNIDVVFWMSIIFGSIGTVLFFLSLSGFLLEVVQKNKKLYFKNLNMFVLRQLNSKINTTFLSVSVICIMLLIAIGTLAGGIGISDALTVDLRAITPFDNSVSFYPSYTEDGRQPLNGDIVDRIVENDQFSKIVNQYVQYKTYELDTNYRDFLSKDAFKDQKISGNESLKTWPTEAISLSDYNRIIALHGEAPIVLEKKEYAFLCNVEEILPYFNQSAMPEILIHGNHYQYQGDGFLGTQLSNAMILDEAGTVVLPDEALANAEAVCITLNINYNKKAENPDDVFEQEILRAASDPKSNDGYSFVSREEIYNQNTGVKVMVSYLATYIGFVFLITCAAVLALQQLSESSDNIARYQLLRQLGADEKTIQKTLFSQIFIYFMMPLSLAIVHSIVGISVLNNVVALIGSLNILQNALFTAGIIILIYGAYFMATYFGSRAMIRQK